MKKKLLGSVFLLAGTAIGSGMLSLPIVLSKYGIRLSLLIMLAFTWVTYFSSIIRCDLNIHSDSRFSLQDVGEHFSGNIAKQIGSISFKLLSYSLMAAYLHGAASLLNVFLEYDLRVTIVLLGIFAILVLLLNTTVIVKTNKTLFIVMMIALFAVIFDMLSRFDFSNSNIPGISSSLSALTLLSALPIAFTAFGFQGSLHSMTKFVENDEKLIKKACFYGSLTPAIVYISWMSCVMFVVFNSSTEFFHKMITSDVSVDELILCLTNKLGSSHLKSIMCVISALALSTSAIGVGVAIFDEWKYSFEKKSHNSKIIPAIISIVPPILIAATVKNAFIKVLNVSGIILSVIAIFLPCFLYIKMAKIKHLTITKERMAGMIVLTIIGILICISGVVDLLQM